MLFDHDLPQALAEELAESQVIAWDIETTGLDWQTERIGTCQLRSPSVGTVIVQRIADPPSVLAGLLSDSNILKVFHHAMFDLRFMCSQWNAEAVNIACTKIASKLMHPEWDPRLHSLKPLVRYYLQEALDKSEQVSDWVAAELSESQIQYAAEDVRHLIPLLAALKREALRTERVNLLEACFVHIPTRVELELRGYGDVFLY